MGQALKRKEIIELWQECNPKRLDSYCCPDCRDILIEDDNGYLVCHNDRCLNESYFHKNGDEV